VVWRDTTYFPQHALLMRVVTLVLIVSPARAELTLFEHRAFLEVVGVSVAPSTGRPAGYASVESLVMQLLACDAYLSFVHTRDLVSSVDACHYAFVGVGFGQGPR
jgi:hypothetical protein